MKNSDQIKINSLKGITDSIADLTSGTGLLMQAFNKISSSVDRLTSDISELNGSCDKLNNVNGILVQGLEIVNSSFLKLNSNITLLTGSTLPEYSDSINNIKSENDNLNSTISSFISLSAELATVFSGLAAASQVMNVTIAETSSVFAIFTAAIIATTSNVQMFMTAIRNISEGESIWRNLSDNLIGGMIKSLLGLGNASDVAKTKLIDISNEVANLKSQWDGMEFTVHANDDFKKSETYTQQTIANIKTKTANDIELKQAKQNLEIKRQTLTNEKDLLDNKKQINIIEAEIKRRSGNPVIRSNHISSGVKQEIDLLGDELTQIDNILKNTELKDKLSIDILNTQLEKVKSLFNETLALEDQNRVLMKQKEILDKINRNFSPIFKEAVGGERSIAEKGNIKKVLNPRINSNDPRSDMTANDFLEMAKKQDEFEKQRLEYARGMWSNFQGMLEATGLMKGQFGEIISFINSFISSISSGVSFVDSLLGFFSSFIPGGSVIAGAVGGGTIGGMQHGYSGGLYNTSRMLNSARGNTSFTAKMQPINISGELRLRGKDAVYIYDRNKAIQQSLIN